MAAYKSVTRGRGLFRALPRKVLEPLLLPQYALLVIQYLTLLAALENLKLETLDLDFPHTRARKGGGRGVDANNASAAGFGSGWYRINRMFYNNNRKYKTCLGTLHRKVFLESKLTYFIIFTSWLQMVEISMVKTVKALPFCYFTHVLTCFSIEISSVIILFYLIGY